MSFQSASRIVTIIAVNLNTDNLLRKKIIGISKRPQNPLKMVSDRNNNFNIEIAMVRVKSLQDAKIKLYKNSKPSMSATDVSPFLSFVIVPKQ